MMDEKIERYGVGERASKKKSCSSFVLREGDEFPECKCGGNEWVRFHPANGKAL